MKSIRPFHLAFPVKDIKEAKSWYTKVLGCSLGRESETWIDFNFFGNQISAHLAKDSEEFLSKNIVDKKEIPLRHFGIIMEWESWENLSNRLKKIEVDFIIDPYIRFKGQSGEQGTMFIKDPSGNFLEFKTFKEDSRIFEKEL